MVYTHSRGRKVHVTLNIIPHNEDLIGIEEYIRELYEIGVDAVLIADPGIMSIVREVAPNLEIHLSTQASNLNYKFALFWHKIGIKRIVAAREMSLEELRELRRELPETCDIEAFVHGAMCMGYSDETSAYIHNYDMVGVVLSYDKETKIAKIHQRNKVCSGDLIEVLAIKGKNVVTKLEDMKNESGELIESASHPQMIFTVKSEEELKVNDILVKNK